jgi:hypothetical protein
MARWVYILLLFLIINFIFFNKMETDPFMKVHLLLAF